MSAALFQEFWQGCGGCLPRHSHRPLENQPICWSWAAHQSVSRRVHRGAQWNPEVGSSKRSLFHFLIPSLIETKFRPPQACWHFSLSSTTGAQACVFTCPLALPQPFVLQSYWLLPTVLASSPILVNPLRILEMAQLLEGQPEGETSHLLTNGFRGFSCSASLLRNSCLSKNQCFSLVFICSCMFW